VQRRTAVALGVLFAAAALVLAVWTGVPARGKSSEPKPAAKASSAPAPRSAASSAIEAPLELELTPEKTGGKFDKMPDGTPVPELPAAAPKTVKFGVVLVTYRGAQLAPDTAPPRAEAQNKAKTLLDEAQKDFAAAVKKGDRGSQVDAGRIPRGILEPAVEYVLFSIPKGAVHPEPIDTPRGFWILKRIE
jgi:hypothetical protein